MILNRRGVLSGSSILNCWDLRGVLSDSSTIKLLGFEESAKW